MKSLFMTVMLLPTLSAPAMGRDTACCRPVAMAGLFVDLESAAN